ncbi:MAG: triose-phosphate isomerase [Ponticaulis sp.]|nr:triose-phosphate isomerase [Ponticaulis sp.]
MPRPLIAGNWKMNGVSSSVSEIDSLIKGLKSDQTDAEILICPPATLLDRISNLCRETPVKTGAQDCHFNASGAHTGDISADMVADLGGSYVIVGHSERRADHGETNEIVRDKAKAVSDAGLTPIICIGETQAEREAGQTLDVLDTQLTNSLPDDLSGERFVVAYEPVWAIGTGLVPEITDIAEAHKFMRDKLKGLGVENADDVRLLYGGSVKPGNAKDILAVENVDGALVGGASLKAEDFLGIIFPS